MGTRVLRRRSLRPAVLIMIQFSSPEAHRLSGSSSMFPSRNIEAGSLLLLLGLFLCCPWRMRRDMASFLARKLDLAITYSAPPPRRGAEATSRATDGTRVAKMHFCSRSQHANRHANYELCTIFPHIESRMS